MPQFVTARSVLRESNYGALLRVPVDKLPSLTGMNAFAGTNQFQDLFVQNLYVQQTLEIYDANIDISANASSQLGTADPQDFWLKSNGIARLGLMSGGAYLFTSSQPSSIFTTVLFTDAFTRANISPLDNWTTQTGASALQLSSNAVHTTGAAGAICAAYPTGDTWDLSAADAQVLVSGNGATNDRCGVSVFMASGGASGYDVVFQQNVNQIQIRKRTGPAADSSLLGFASQGHFGTLRALASAHSTGTTISAFKDSTYVGATTDTSVPYSVGFAGIRGSVDNPATHNTLIDDFSHASTTTPPFSAGDIVWQTSASLWSMLGTTGATKHAQVFSDSLQLGFSKPVIFTGLTSAFVSAGTSAYFNTATYGVVRLSSAAGGALSGVVGFSATGGVTPSAVGNDIAWLKNDIFGLSAVGTAVSGASGVVALSGVGLTVSAVAAGTIMFSAAAPGGTNTDFWGFRNLKAGNLAGTSASGNVFLAADYFRVFTPATFATVIGTGLAVSCNVTVSGANGRDTAAAFAAPSWVHVYAISGISGVVGLASSAVPSAGPVFPGGYNSFAYAGALRMTAASALVDTYIRGSWAWYEDVGTAVAVGGGTALTETAVNFDTLIPPNAANMFTTAICTYTSSVAGDTGTVALRLATGQDYFTPAVVVQVANLNNRSDVSLVLPNVGQNAFYLWYASGTRSFTWVVRGYEMPNGNG